jgi:branched-chain amino acid aminotransferase
MENVNGYPVGLVPAAVSGECFGTGTAATLSHMRRIRYRDRDIVMPPVEARTVGPEVRRRLIAIATGEAPDPHGWLEVI